MAAKKAAGKDSTATKKKGGDLGPRPSLKDVFLRDLGPRPKLRELAGTPDKKKAKKK